MLLFLPSATKGKQGLDFHGYGSDKGSTNTHCFVGIIVEVSGFSICSISTTCPEQMLQKKRLQVGFECFFIQLKQICSDLKGLCRNWPPVVSYSKQTGATYHQSNCKLLATESVVSQLAQLAMQLAAWTAT